MSSDADSPLVVDRRDQAIAQLDAFAGQAEPHARQLIGTSIGTDDHAAADRSIDRISRHIAAASGDGPDRRQIELLAMAYGCWIGSWACRTLGATWVGLTEPTPPRLAIGGALASPIDAVRRRLLGVGDNGSLVQIADRLRRLADEDKHALSPQQLDRHNAAAWDAMADVDRFAGGDGLPTSPSAALSAIDPALSAIWRTGIRVLCLAAGGGRQGPLHAIAGADVTVVDISEQQLRHDRDIAARRGLRVRCLQTSATDLRELPADHFDAVVQPVSTCYLVDLAAMYRSVRRVIRRGGLYLSQHKQPAAMTATTSSGPVTTYRHARPHAGSPRVSRSDVAGVQVVAPENALIEPGTIEIAHSLQSILGGMCAAGFAITGVREPCRGDVLAPPGTIEHLASHLPPYLTVVSEAVGRGASVPPSADHDLR